MSPKVTRGFFQKNLGSCAPHNISLTCSICESKERDGPRFFLLFTNQDLHTKTRIDFNQQNE